MIIYVCVGAIQFDSRHSQVTREPLLRDEERSSPGGHRRGRPMWQPCAHSPGSGVGLGLGLGLGASDRGSSIHVLGVVVPRIPRTSTSPLSPEMGRGLGLGFGR